MNSGSPRIRISTWPRTFRRSATALLAFFTCVSYSILSDQDSSKAQVNSEPKKLESSAHRPDLGIDINNVSKLKIFNPKSEFRFQDTLLIDVALLTSKEDFYYFPKILEPLDLVIKEKNGDGVSIRPIFSLDRFAEFEKRKNDLIKNTVRLIVGCNNKILKQLERDGDLVDEDDPSDIFDRDLFWSIPQYCIDVDRSSELEISATLRNDLVVLQEKGNEVKTAVGRIESNTLKLKIIID